MASMQQRLHHAHDFTPAARAVYLNARRHGLALPQSHALARVCGNVEASGRSGAWAYDRCAQIVRKTVALRAAPIAPAAEPVSTKRPDPPRLPINALSPTERSLLNHYRLAAAEDRRRVRDWLSTAIQPAMA